MPATRITTNFEFGARRDEMVEEFHAVMQATFGILEHDRLVIVDERVEGFYQPTNTTGNYVFVEISLFPGRTLEKKRALYQSLVELFGKYDVPPENTRFVLYEAERESWGVRSGQAGCDIDYTPK